jgi:hypothetical protein
MDSDGFEVEVLPERLDSGLRALCGLAAFYLLN